MNSSRFVAIGQAVRSRAELQERHYKCLCSLIGILSKATQIEETLNKILKSWHVGKTIILKSETTKNWKTERTEKKRVR